MQSTEKWSCGITKILDTFSGKWRLNVLWMISKNEGIGFNKLKQAIPEITNIMLVRSLETLLSAGYISKTISGEKPPFRSKYYLNSKSKELLPLLLQLNDWGGNSN